VTILILLFQFRAQFHPFRTFWFAGASDEADNTSILIPIRYYTILSPKSGSFTRFRQEITRIYIHFWATLIPIDIYQEIEKSELRNLGLE